MDSREFINKLKQKGIETELEHGRVANSISNNSNLSSNESGTWNSSAFIQRLKEKGANTPKVNYVPTTVTTNKEPTLLEKFGFYKIGEAPKSTNTGSLVDAITNNKLLDYTNLLGVSAAQGTKDAVANIGTAVGNYSSAALDAINQDKASEKVDNVVQNIYNWQNKENESYQKEVSNHDVNTLEKVGIDVASGVGGMVPSIATSLLTGGPGAFVPLFLSASGGKMKEVYDTVGNNEDSTRAKALLAGTLSGGVEIATEKLFGFTKLFGGTLELDDYLSKYLTKNVTNEVSKVLIDTMIGMAGEGTEELISEYADAFITKIYNDNGESFLQTIVNTSPDAFYSFLIGGLTAGVMESVNIVNDTRNAITTEQQKKNVLKKSLDKAAVEATQSFEQNVTNNQQNVNAEQQTKMNNVVDDVNNNSSKNTFNLSDDLNYVGKNIAVKVAHTKQDLINFFNKWRNTNNNQKEKLLLGKPTSNYVVNSLNNIVDGDLSNYVFSISSDAMRHVEKYHGDTTNKHGTIPITEENISLIIDTIENPDKVSIVNSNSPQNRFVFEKKLDKGSTVYLQFENKSRNELEGISFYINPSEVYLSEQNKNASSKRQYTTVSEDMSSTALRPERSGLMRDGSISTTINSIGQNSNFDNNDVLNNKKSGSAPAIGLQLPKATDTSSTTNSILQIDKNATIQNENIKGNAALDQKASTTSPNINSIQQNNETATKSIEKTEKVKKYEKAAKNKLIQYLADEFHISRYQVKNLVGDFIDLATDQIQSNNKVDSIIMKDIFNKLADNSYTVDDELRNNYKYLIDDLKNTTFQLNDDTRNGMSEPELKLFKKQNRGKFNIGDTGIPVDVKYQELSSMYPELFPSDISSGDMLNQISEVLESFDEKYTRNSDVLNNDPIMKEASMMDFNNKYNDFLNSMRNAQNVASEIAAKKELKDSFDYNFYKEQEEKIAKLEREYTKVNNKTVLDAKGKHFLDGLMNGVITVDDVDPEYRNDVLSMYKVKKPYEDAKNVIKTYRNVYKEGLRERARGLISGIETWQVQKKINGLAFELDTAERNIRDIAGADAEDIINEYFAPVHKNEAEANKFKNRIRKRIKELNLTKEEAEAVQLLGERADINGREYNESDVVEAGLDLEKVTNSVNEFRSIYNELHNQVNEVLVRNGYNPIEFRKDYFPHFIDQEPDTKLGKVLKKMGINVAENNLNADISGLTEYFRPGKSFFGNALHRKTNKTAYNAVEGADRYIEGIANLIYHTDDIQRLRALDTEIRYQTSDEGFKKRIDEIYDDDTISEEERQEKLQNEYQKQGIITRFGNLTTWLTNYTNNLANKKSAADRKMEYDLGRGVYTISKELEGRVAANMVAANASSAMSNFIPITQALGECSISDIYSAMVDTVNNYFTDDGFMEESVFLTNRVGSDRLSKTTLQQLSDKASIAFTLIDDFVSNTVTRAKYKGNISKGMSHEEALSNADSYAASLMADRSKGSVPLVFERKNPLAKLFTMFQLEQNNQIRYLMKDLPQNKKDEAAKAVLLAIMRMAIGAWCFNEINERLFGRRSALDPIDMAYNAWETASGNGKTSEKITTIAKDVAEEIPFVGGLLGGGRMPISAALPDGGEVLKLFDSNTTDEKRGDIIINDVIKPLSYVAAPFGAGQAWKSGEGVKAVLDGGVYNVTNEGKELKYPVEQNLQNLIKGLIGGKSSFKEAVDYYDKGYYKLSAKTRTKAYGAEDYGMSIDEYLKLYDEVKAITSLKDKDGDPVANSSSILKRKEIDEYTTDKKLRQYLYDCYGVSETVQNYTDNELFLAQRKLHEYYKYNK